MKGKDGEKGWADNTNLDDTCRVFTKDRKSVECHCKLIPFGNGFMYDYKSKCEVHGEEVLAPSLKWTEELPTKEG